MFRRLQILTQWNYLLILAGTSTVDIVLFASLQWRVAHPDSSFSSLSSQFALVMMGVIAVLMCGITYLVTRWREVHSQDEAVAVDERNIFLAQWNKCQILFRGYSLKSRLTSSFYLIYTVRFFLPMLIAVYGYPAPLLQVLSYLAISIAILAYILLTNPLENALNYVQLVVLEVMILIINICLVALTFLSSAGMVHTSMAILLGDVVILWAIL